MAEKSAVYYDKASGLVVESLWDGGGELEVNGNKLEKLIPNTTDAATEKHVPVITQEGNKVTVKVGEAAHPMDSNHYILFIEVLAGNKVYRQDFKEGDSIAEAAFTIEDPVDSARAYCNLHGFWSTK